MNYNCNTINDFFDRNAIIINSSIDNTINKNNRITNYIMNNYNNINIRNNNSISKMKGISNDHSVKQFKKKK